MDTASVLHLLIQTLYHFAWFAGVVLVLHICERVWPADRHPKIGDLAFNFALAYVASILATLLANAAPLAKFAADWLGLRCVLLRGWRPRSGAEIVLAALAYAFVWDFCQYWFHRLQHAVPRLWFMHALHHDTATLNSSDALRNTLWHHVAGGILVGLPLAIVGAEDLLTPYATYVLFSTYGFYNHANLRWSHGPLTAVLSGPQLHRLHHGLDYRYYNTNYAAFFPIIDIVFGTYRPPSRDEFPRTGLADRLQSSGGPLRICAAMLGMRGHTEDRRLELHSPEVGVGPQDPLRGTDPVGRDGRYGDSAAPARRRFSRSSAVAQESRAASAL